MSERPRRRWRLPWLLILIALAGAGWIAAGAPTLPDRYNPLKPLAIDDPPNLLTRWKLARLDGDAPLCLSVLRRAAGVSVEPAPDQRGQVGCELENVVRIERMQTNFSPRAPVATCRAAVAWAMYERHGLNPAARAAFGSGVARVEHLGTYACRNIYHREQGRRSEHATANAIDVAAFVLENGRRIEILRDWPGEADRAAFLRQARDAACRFFNVVLGPDYNQAHRNHFHLDMGGYRACR